VDHLFAGFIKQGVLHFQETLEILGSVQRVISLSLSLSLSSNGCILCLSLHTTMATDTTKGFDLNDWYQAHLYIYQSNRMLDESSDLLTSFLFMVDHHL